MFHAWSLMPYPKSLMRTTLKLLLFFEGFQNVCLTWSNARVVSFSPCKTSIGTCALLLSMSVIGNIKPPIETIPPRGWVNDSPACKAIEAPYPIPPINTFLLFWSSFEISSSKTIFIRCVYPVISDTFMLFSKYSISVL